MQANDICPPGGRDLQIEKLAELYIQDEQLDLASLLADPSIGRIALVTSFGAESAILLHMISMVSDDFPILFIDTGKHFDETYVYAKQLTARLRLKNVQFVKPEEKLLKQEDPRGMLWRRDANMCCTIRKTFALQDALVDFDGWITGRKRYQGGRRANLSYLERDGKHLKINPLVHYTPEMIEAYFSSKELPRHPLGARGYRSIGCAPCTAPVKDGEEPRAGRWRGLDKVECGIHLGPDGSITRLS